MAKQITEYERGHINGFYGALIGAQYSLELPGATVENTLGAIKETIEQMKKDGDLEHVSGVADAILDIVKDADKTGDDKWLKILDDVVFGGK